MIFYQGHPIGQRQDTVIRRARRSRYSYVMPANYLERRACRRLTARGIMSPALGFPDVWRLLP
jgi:hypothetical protein